MSYELTIKASTLAELGQRLLAAGAQMTGAQAQPALAKTVSVGVNKLALAATAAQEPAGDPAEEEEEQNDTSNQNDAKSDEYDYAIHVAPRVLFLVDKKGRDAAKEVLASFGAKRASDVPTEKYGALISALDDAARS